MLKPSPLQVVNTPIILSIGRAAPFWGSLMDLCIAAKVVHDATHFRNQPCLCTDTLPLPSNLGLCQVREKTSLEAKKERRLKERSIMIFNCALEFLIQLMALPAHLV